MRKKTVCVVGLGYIGLPTARCWRESYQVVGVDLNVHAVNTINKGQIHIVEPDLAPLSARGDGRQAEGIRQPPAGDST